MTIIAFIALSLSVGGWLGVRYANALNHLESDITRFVLTVPVTDREDTL